jgi:hypothetical protein
MRRLGGIPNTRQFRELIREEALPSPRLAKAPILPIAPMAPVSMAKFPTSPVAPIAPNAVAQSAMANLPVEMQTILMPDPVSPIAQSGISDMDTDIDREIEKALASVMAREGEMQMMQDPVTVAVETAVGNGQPTMDNAILDINRLGEQLPLGTDNGIDISEFLGSREENLESLQTMFGPQVQYATPTTATNDSGGLLGRTLTDEQPDFMTQLNDLIAQMQLEQVAAAEQQQQQEQQRQERTAEMTQNYLIGQPAVGYNPYQSGQYQNNPYGAAGVPNMGGITSIPVPAPYQAPRTMT